MTDATDGAPQASVLDRPIRLDGKAYTVRFSMIAMEALKQAWGLEPWDDDRMIVRVARQAITDLPTRVWACLLAHHPEVDRKEIMKLFDRLGPCDEVRDAGEATMQSVSAGWGKPTGKKSEAAAKGKS